jgi:hypothetical protein
MSQRYDIVFKNNFKFGNKSIYKRAIFYEPRNTNASDKTLSREYYKS